MKTKSSKTSFKRVLLIVFVILICLTLFRFIFISAKQYYPSAAECVEHGFGKTIDSMLFEYENENQGFYICQSRDDDMVISVLKIRNINNKKYYKFKKLSSSGSLYSIISNWSSMGDFEYFIAKDEDFLKKYGKGKTPTYTQTIEYQVDGKNETSVVWLIDKTV